jgi:N utilization substance protein A
MKGSRVQNVVQELRGEKIDIIPWHVDPAKFVCNALAPAEISRVIIDEDNRGMEVIVPDDFLSIAIGKKGQNVRLASKLTGWHLDVKSESQYSQDMQVGYDSLVSLPGVGVSLADALYERGLYSAEEISKATVEDLVQIRGIGPEKAATLLDAAQAMLEEDAAMPVDAEAGADAAEGEDMQEPAPGAEDLDPGQGAETQSEAAEDLDPDQGAETQSEAAEDLDPDQGAETQSEAAEDDRLPEDKDQPVSEEEPGSIT